MREHLHQACLALALPFTVATVWVVRGEPAPSVPLERATAYRVELAELPLPTPLRLRSPHHIGDWRRAPSTASEEPFARHPRAALPEPPAPQPVALGAPTGSLLEPTTIASPGIAQPELPLADRASALTPRPPELSIPTPPIVATRAGSDGAREASPEDAGHATGAAPETEAAVEARVAATGRLSYAVDSVSPVPAAYPSAASPVLATRTSATIPVAAARASALIPALAARTSAANPAPAAAEVHDAAAPPRDPASPVGEPTSRGIEKSWRDGIAAAPPSPALALATREAKQALDLWLERSGREPEPLEIALPAAAAAAPPQLRSFAPESTPAASDRGQPETTQRLFDLALPAPTVFASANDEPADASLPGFGAGSRHFPPVLTLFAIPEPGSAALLSVALAILAAARRCARRT